MRSTHRHLTLPFTLLCLLFIGFFGTKSLAAEVGTALVTQRLPHTAAVPGGVVILDIGPASDPAPEVYYRKKRVMVVQNNGQWQAVVGISLTAKPGQHQIQIKGQSTPLPFQVNAKQYPEQYLTIKNKRKVNPNKTDMKRIQSERGRINAALRHWEPQAEIETHFSLPLKGRFSSPFGLRRFFNKQPRKPHSGIDIAAPKGTPIHAPAAGKIIERGEFFFNGKSVFIEHGQGLVTLYAHMSRIDVEPGQRVSRGEIIGAVGQTGRATGPHLHWGVSLNNARVDPALFFDDLKSLLAAP